MSSLWQKFTGWIIQVIKKTLNGFHQELLEYPDSPAYAIAPPFRLEPSITIDGMVDGHFEDSLDHKSGNESTRGGSRVTIDALTDVALLEIFHFYVGEDRRIDYVDEQQINAWHALVHVCRKWRNLAFGSPLWLNLRLYCRQGTPVRKTLDVWPLLPIVIRANGYENWRADNIIAVLEHSDRICHLELVAFPSSQFGMLWEALSQQPFSALTYLSIQKIDDEAAPTVIPASFLNGSAPRLRNLTLASIPFPGLPKLLLSSTGTHLVDLTLISIPHSGYISPEAMVAGLSVLTRLETLCLRFESPRSRPDRKGRRPPPSTRTLLPVLTGLTFNGVSEYLEDLVARIDAPLLENLEINFFLQLIFHTPQLAQYISRTPMLKSRDVVHVLFSVSDVSVTLPQTIEGGPGLELGIKCERSDWQLSSVAQLCGTSFPQVLISAVEHLYLQSRFLTANWQDDIEISQWLELLRPFTAVKNLYITKEFVPHIAPALKELAGERVTELLPALQTLFLEEDTPLLLGPFKEMIDRFVTTRQLARSRWKNHVVHA